MNTPSDPPRAAGTDGSGAKRFAFPRRLRVISRAEFRRAFDAGRRASDNALRVWVLANDRGATRFGVSVGKRHGGAVRRNRMKRMLREAFRLARPELPAGIDIICVPRENSELELSACIESLTGLVRRAVKRI